MFEPLPSQFSFPEAEQRVLEFWEQRDIFQKSLDIRRGAPRFVFYEGPPTANGLPHPGHCLTRAIKDLFPRYKTMCGHLVERKAGWDTHGLPVEVEVCKELGIHTKEEIEAYGVEKFVQRCIESVFRYVGEWEQMTRRLGFWVNLEDAYVTFHQSYVESVWWSLKTLFERGLLYQGHKVVWWWAQGGTALSAGEVGEGYRTVKDPSVYVRFPLVAADGSSAAAVPSAPRGRLCPHADLPGDAKVALLVWTTTPWTLISNHFCAVGPDIDYALVHDKTTDEYLYIAAALVPDVAGKVKHDLETVGVCKGSDLVGWRYVPPFREAYYDHARSYPGQFWGARIPTGPLAGLSARLDAGTVTPSRPLGEHRMPRGVETEGQAPRIDFATATYVHVGWRVVPADFVALDTGTGLVHQAPAYGEVDFALWIEESRPVFGGLPLLNAVAPDGTFTDEAPPAYRGRWVKDCDSEIMREMKDRGILYHQETIEHEYPFCPRAEDDPLIQYARKSWFVRTSQFKEEFLKNNAGITWLPEHIKEGRFGDFLRNNVDWALSRERYWGTPLPIWVCEKCGKMEAVGSYAELLAKPGVQGTEVWEQAKAANPDLPEHLKVHKPYIDAVTYDSPFETAEAGTPTASGGPTSGRSETDQRSIPHETDQRSIPHETDQRSIPQARARMRRVPEVIDCWWDAGSMPFAQWGFPHAPGSIDTFADRFPCDFISEALDQTRGWFYGLLAISTLLFGGAVNRVIGGGTGVSPVVETGTTANLRTRRRNLPHWEAGGSTYFVTFRTKSEALSDEERDLVLATCRHWDDERLILHAAAVMPDHVHLLFTPLEKSANVWWSLPELMHSIKSFSGHEIAKRRGLRGSVWLDESYDRIIRDASDFDEKLRYILENAARAGLTESYRWLWLEPTHADHRRDACATRAGEDTCASRAGILDHRRDACATPGASGTARDHRRDACATLENTEYPHPYKACIVLGLMMGEDGLKMSKRKKNYREPGYIFDHYGADAMRWFLFSGQTPWTSVRFQEQNIRDAQREFLVRLYNVFSFFNIYANIDGFDPGTGRVSEEATAQRADEGRRPSVPTFPPSHVPTFPPPHATGWRPVTQRSELDRWIISELHRTIRFVRESMDRFENYPAAGRINDFVDALSNWYVRRSRERFWRPVQGTASRDQETESAAREGGAVAATRPHVPTFPRSHADQDKWDAYNTLYEVLAALSKLVAPFTPFFAETMYQNLAGGRGGEGPRGQGEAGAIGHSAPPVSVHLCDYPVADESLIDEKLAAEMDLVRDVVSLGRAARTAAKLKVRQPLALAEIILARPEHAGSLATHSDLIADELNIKRVELSTEAEQYVTYQIKPDFKVIGPKFGKLAPRVAAALAQCDAAEVRRSLASTGRYTLNVDGEPTTLLEQDVEVRLEAKAGWSAAQGRAGVVVVKTELTDELRDEGLCREVIHLVQALRKTKNLPYEARITLYVQGAEKLVAVVRRFAATIESECLAASIRYVPPPADAATQAAKIDGHDVTVGIVAG